jgi:hypothetical protein
MAANSICLHPPLNLLDFTSVLRTVRSDREEYDTVPLSELRHGSKGAIEECPQEIIRYMFVYSHGTNPQADEQLGQGRQYSVHDHHETGILRIHKTLSVYGSPLSLEPIFVGIDLAGDVFTWQYGVRYRSIAMGY